MLEKLRNKVNARIAAAVLAISAVFTVGAVSTVTQAPAAEAAYVIYNASGSVGHIEITCKIGNWEGACRLYPGQSYHAYTGYVIVRQGQCVYVEAVGQFCPARGSVWVWVPNYSHYVIRTR